MDSDISKKVVTRFAPSPTGFMHVGNVRTALFSYLFARQNNGTFILRIEDTDKVREVKEAIDHIKKSLLWLGIEWDHGPEMPAPFGSCIQSQRLDIYRRYAESLLKQGNAYVDTYTKDELEIMRNEAVSNNKPFLFREHRPKNLNTDWDPEKGSTLRFKVNNIKRYRWHDEVRGDLEAGEEMLDDFVLIKSDGYPTYNFAHIVDDIEMGVTHIMRGDEFIGSMPKFLSLYEALNVKYPKFVTLPPILNENRTKKLSKRDGSKDLLNYKTEGYLADAMCNFLALIGWNPGNDEEILSKDQLINKFSIRKIQKGGGSFSEEKLKWLNKQHLNLLSDEDYKNYASSYVPQSVSEDEELYTRLLPSIRERAHNGAEISGLFNSEGELNFAIEKPEIDMSTLPWKNEPSLTITKKRLLKVIDILSETNFQSIDSIKESVWSYAESEGKGEVLWPMRVSLTGRERSVDPFTASWIIGKTQTLARLKYICDKIK